MTFVIHGTKEEIAALRAYGEAVREGRIQPPLIEWPLDLPPDTRTEEEKQADHEAFLEDWMAAMTEAIEDPV